MQRIVYLLCPNLPGYAVEQAYLVSRHLPSNQFTTEYVVVGRPRTSELAALQTVSISEGFAGLTDLCRLFANAAPACVHAWGMPAARQLAMLLRLGWCTRGVGSHLDNGGAVGSYAAVARWLSRRLIGTLPTPVVPLAVACPDEPISQQALRSLAIPASAELIVALGDHTHMGNLNAAVWAFDVLKYINPRVWLLVIGRGPRFLRLERFAKAVAREDYRVRFADVPFAEVSRWCALAKVVWVTALNESQPWVLAAQSAGVPVFTVAHSENTPSVAGADADGVTRLPVGRGLILQLANRTRHLLDSPDEQTRLGQLNRAVVRQHHDPSQIARQWARHYVGA